jgi:uncharacterized protein with NRDE domain
MHTRDALIKALEGQDPVNVDRLCDILYDQTPATDDQLPDTGIDLEWEKVLSSPFIATPTYGTRASTVLLIHSDGQAEFTERSFSGPEDSGQTVHHKFRLTGL